MPDNDMAIIPVRDKERATAMKHTAKTTTKNILMYLFSLSIKYIIAGIDSDIHIAYIDDIVTSWINIPKTPTIANASMFDANTSFLDVSYRL